MRPASPARGVRDAPLAREDRPKGAVPGYLAATPPATGVAATRAAALPPLTERQLTEIWRGRRFPEGALVTSAGVPVTLIFQGRPGRGPGPDFRGAVIAGPSGVPLRGDVELHVRSSSFRVHGHHDDAAYANVILHVVFEHDTDGDTPLPGGRTAPVVALAPWVARRAGELHRWLEQPLLWREPCHDAVARMGEGRAGAALDAEGDRRLAARASAIGERALAVGLDQALYERLLEALGFGGNSGPMLALARLVPWRALRETVAADTEAEALLLGGAGLLPSQRAHRGPVDTHVAALESAFMATPMPSLPASAWKLWGVRPVNAPARRIAAAAALLRSLGGPAGVFRCLDGKSLTEIVEPLTAARATGYWLAHHDTCAGPSRLPDAFIGRDRALEIVVNVAIPAALSRTDPALAARARDLYERLPRPGSYGATRFIERALSWEGGRIPVNARRAQGLVALHRDWCSQNGCGRCPLS